jgi:adenylate kinase family enzyme
MKIKSCFLGVFLLLISNYLTACDVLIVMGPSCSGKSTLAKGLWQELIRRTQESGPQWALIDLDDVTEDVKINPDYSSANDLEYLSNAVNKLLDQGKSVVVDTNNYSEKFESELKAEQVKKALIYAPLPVLLARDDHRTKSLKRDSKKAIGAKYFVMDNFAKFFKLSDNLGSIEPLGTLSKESIRFVLDLNPYQICETYFYKTLIKSSEDELYVYSDFKIDVFVDTTKFSVDNWVYFVLMQIYSEIRY